VILDHPSVKQDGDIYLTCDISRRKKNLIGN